MTLNLNGIIPACVVTFDADGKFELAGMGADRVVGLTVSGKGLARMSGLVVTRDGVDVGPLNTLPRNSTRTEKGLRPVFYPPALTFVVEPGYAAEGVVTHKETGKPIPGCRLELNTGFWDRITTVTDADGKYRFDGLTKGMRHYVHVTPPAGAAVFPTWADVTEPAGFATARLVGCWMSVATCNARRAAATLCGKSPRAAYASEHQALRLTWIGSTRPGSFPYRSSGSSSASPTPNSRTASGMRPRSRQACPTRNWA